MRIGIYHNIPFGGALHLLENHIKHLCRRHEIYLYSIDIDENLIDYYGLRYNKKMIPSLTGYVVKEKKFKDPRTLNNWYRRIQKWGRGQDRLKSFIMRKDLDLIEHAAEKIGAAIEKDQCDVVIGHIDKFTQVPVPLSKTSIPTVFFCVEPNRRLYDGGNLAKAVSGFNDPFIRKLLRLDLDVTGSIDQFACDSYFTREFIYQVYGKFAWVIPSAVDINTFKPISGILKENLVLFVGVLMQHKAPMFLMEAMGCIPGKKRPKVIFIYPRGDEGMKRDIKQYAVRNNIEVEFYQGVSISELVNFYNRAKVCAYPAIMEPGGLVPLESQACGTPVVAVNEGGNREEVQNGITGFLTDRDKKQFGKAIEQIISDSRLFENMRESGIDYIRSERTWEHSVSKLESYLHTNLGVERPSVNCCLNSDKGV